ncbi:hypothetical protein ACFU99_07545 [Streptomyces sp. NPDC057654]|uniref:hypothetical protein n=1 Tax=Streptomyces sp. NPDC057654 TaxID=3346196 RepID=UPI00368DCFA8
MPTCTGSATGGFGGGEIRDDVQVTLSVAGLRAGGRCGLGQTRCGGFTEESVEEFVALSQAV